jgi:hypothetical protein
MNGTRKRRRKTIAEKIIAKAYYDGNLSKSYINRLIAEHVKPLVEVLETIDQYSACMYARNCARTALAKYKEISK